MSHRWMSGLVAMLRTSLLLLVLAPALAGATKARGAAANESPWLQALSSAFVVLDMTEGDVDGDGKNETVVCYQDSADNPYSAGGVAILGRKNGMLTPLFHVRLDQTWCEKVEVRGRLVGLMLRSNTLDKKKSQLVWTYGKDIHWLGAPGHPLAGARVTATSTTGGDHGAGSAFDGSLSTTWAEGAPGTGIGEKLSVKLPRAMDVAYVAIYGGHGGGSRDFLENNRIHRGSIEAKTSADLGDVLAGIDFSELGIDAGGDRVHFVLENRPQVTYVRVDKRDVSELELRIDSVFLGQRKDDVHVAEIEIVPRLDLAATLDRARPLSAKRDDDKPKKPGAQQKKDDEDEGDELGKPSGRGDEALKELDKDGRGLDIADEEL